VRRRAVVARAEVLAEGCGAMGAGRGAWGEFLRFLDNGLAATLDASALRIRKFSARVEGKEHGVESETGARLGKTYGVHRVY